MRGDDLQGLNTDLENIQGVAQPGHGHREQGAAGHAVHAVAVRVFALLDSDLGRSLLSAPTTVEIPGFEAALRGVVADGLAGEHRGG